MPTIREKLNFNFDNKWSTEFGLVNARTDNGMYEEAFTSSRDIIETELPNSEKPIYHGYTTSPLEFDMEVVFMNGFDENMIDEVIEWLFVDYYKPLYFEGASNKLFYCMPVGEPSIIHNGLKQGYFTITMRCNSSKIYSPKYVTDEYVVTGSMTIEIDNDGHEIIYPEISILKNGSGTITITNSTDGGSFLEIQNLTDLEDLYINCDKELIETDAVGVYRYGDIVGEYTRLQKGKNTIQISGDCNIRFRYQYKYKF